MFRFLRLWFGAILRLFRSRQDLLVENLALRQQLSVLKRRNRRPKLAVLDKLFWVLARRNWPGTGWPFFAIIAKRSLPWISSPSQRSPSSRCTRRPCCPLAEGPQIID